MPSSSTLSSLGVQGDSLSSEEIASLDQQGFVNLGVLLSPEQLNTLRDKTDSLLAAEGQAAGSELFDSPHIRHPKEAGADRLADLVNKGEEFDLFYSHSRVLAAVAHVLGDSFQLSSLNYRAAKPGQGAQRLHADWHEAVASTDYLVCNSIWLLDDFSAENGATRVVPGTHLSKQLPGEATQDPMDTHPDQQLIELPAGSVVVFNSHTWHGGTTNTTNLPRRAIHSYFCRRDQPQQLDQNKYLHPSTATRLTQAQLSVLGIFGA
ncbi:MAG: phytanoyl-CoA dioxygenase family protein [Aureliella sp.]